MGCTWDVHGNIIGDVHDFYGIGGFSWHSSVTNYVMSMKHLWISAGISRGPLCGLFHKQKVGRKL